MKKNKKLIAVNIDTPIKENLPFQYVLYSGTFFAFQKKLDSEPYFCSCSYEAIKNYINIRTLAAIPDNSNPLRKYILDPYDFPEYVVADLYDKKVKKENVINCLKFKDKLCHECNKKVPNYRSCNEMYGGVFKQNYGWYIKKQFYEWGIHPLLRLDKYIPELCPEEIISYIDNNDLYKIKKKIDYISLELDKLGNLNITDNIKHDLYNNICELRKVYNKHIRKINNVVENEVRSKFGHKKIGESWTSETILYYIIKKLYPDLTIFRHYRPEILERLELDIYIEDLKIGIEYQGIQHFKPVKHWGGIESFEKLQERDKRKKQLCKKNNIRLIYFNYNESLSDNIVRDKIQKYK